MIISTSGELLDTLPPGVDEAVAISKVVAFTKSPDYAHFSRIIFDTAPTGHTLRLLTLPDFLDASLGARDSLHLPIHITPRSCSLGECDEWVFTKEEYQQ